MGAIRWDFTQGTEGWHALHSVSPLKAEGGRLKGNIIAEDPYIASPRFRIPAEEIPTLILRMRITAGTTAEVFWATQEYPSFRAGWEQPFSVIPDGQFHEYRIKLRRHPDWKGVITQLRIDPNTGEHPAEFEIDFLHLLQEPVKLVVEQFDPDRRIITTNSNFQISARIRNEGDLPTSLSPITLQSQGLAATLTIPPPSSLAPDQTVEIQWSAKAQNPGIHPLTLALAGEPLSQKNFLVVPPSVLKPSLPKPCSLSIFRDKLQNVYLTSGSFLLYFPHTSLGYPGGILYWRQSGQWQSLATLWPLSQALLLQKNGEKQEVLFLPSQIEGLSPLENRRGIRFIGRSPSAPLEFQAEFSLVEQGFRVTYSLKATQPLNLVYWRGPHLEPGESSFGVKKDEALFPGLEWLEGQEESSSTLDVHPPLHLRVVPHPYKITVPLMALRLGRTVISLLWSPLQKWDGQNLAPSARFSSPNKAENQKNHLFELFLPSVPRWISENQTEGSPYNLLPGRPLQISAIISIQESNTVLASLRRWLQYFPPAELPPLPQGWTWDTVREECLTGFLETAWEETAQGWRHATGFGPQPSATFAGLLLGAAMEETNPQRRQRLEQQARTVVQKLLKEGGPPSLVNLMGSHIHEWTLPFLVDYLPGALEGMRQQAEEARARQSPEGGWFFRGDPRFGKPTDTELGICAWPALTLLRYARLTGDPLYIEAGLRALHFMKRFRVPRAAQVWELAVHTPDILAAGLALRCYLEGYAITGKQEYLEEARYWALAGLPFLYLWKAPDREVMAYSSIPVFGASFYTVSWFGLPVQWNGLVYAFPLWDLAQYDSSIPWSRIAEGILRSGIQQMAASPYRGLYPDSFRLLADNKPQGPYLQPENLLKNYLRLKGGVGLLNQRTLEWRGKRIFLSTAGQILKTEAGDSLLLETSFPTPQKEFLLLTNLPRPQQVFINSEPLPERGDLSEASSGWHWWRGDRDYPYYGTSFLEIKVPHQEQRVRIQIKMPED